MRRITLETSEVFVERLRAALRDRVPRRVEDAGARRAAVAVVISEGTAPAILFVRRKERLGDPWSGQVALPGGFHSAGDASLTETAARETLEETGVDLAAAGKPLGELDDVSPRSVYLPPVVVTPILFLVHRQLDVVPGPEIDAAVWLPVPAVFAAHNRRPFTLTLPAETRHFEAIVVGDYTIWGLTERVLRQLADLTA